MSQSTVSLLAKGPIKVLSRAPNNALVFYQSLAVKMGSIEIDVYLSQVSQPLRG